jgi:hypothetical protein
LRPTGHQGRRTVGTRRTQVDVRPWTNAGRRPDRNGIDPEITHQRQRRRSPPQVELGDRDGIRAVIAHGDFPRDRFEAIGVAGQQLTTGDAGGASAREGNVHGASGREEKATARSEQRRPKHGRRHDGGGNTDATAVVELHSLLASFVPFVRLARIADNGQSDGFSREW